MPKVPQYERQVLPSGTLGAPKQSFSLPADPGAQTAKQAVALGGAVLDAVVTLRKNKAKTLANQNLTSFLETQEQLYTDNILSRRGVNADEEMVKEYSEALSEKIGELSENIKDNAVRRQFLEAAERQKVKALVEASRYSASELREAGDAAQKILILQTSRQAVNTAMTPEELDNSFEDMVSPHVIDAAEDKGLDQAQAREIQKGIIVSQWMSQALRRGDLDGAREGLDRWRSILDEGTVGELEAELARRDSLQKGEEYAEDALSRWETGDLTAGGIRDDLADKFGDDELAKRTAMTAFSQLRAIRKEELRLAGIAQVNSAVEKVGTLLSGPKSGGLDGMLQARAYVQTLTGEARDEAEKYLATRTERLGVPENSIDPAMEYILRTKLKLGVDVDDVKREAQDAGWSTEYINEHIFGPAEKMQTANEDRLVTIFNQVRDDVPENLIENPFDRTSEEYKAELGSFLAWVRTRTADDLSGVDEWGQKYVDEWYMLGWEKKPKLGKTPGTYAGKLITEGGRGKLSKFYAQGAEQAYNGLSAHQEWVKAKYGGDRKKAISAITVWMMETGGNWAEARDHFKNMALLER